MPGQLRLAIRMLRRDWRAGELRVLAGALVVAVAAVSAVGFFTDRIHQGLKSQANELLGADLKITSDRPLAERFSTLAQARGLEISQTLAFPSMVIAGEDTQLGRLKFVDAAYPLRGTVYVSDRLFAPDAAAGGIPQPGEVWLEARIFLALNIQPGDTVQIGLKAFTASRVLVTEPGSGGDVFALAPGVLLNQADLTASGLLGPGSRVSYAMLIGGDRAAIRAYRRQIDGDLPRGVSLQGIEDARPEIRTALARSEQFLGLAAMTSVILSAIAIALAARRYAQRHLDHCAIMRCLGAVQATVLQVYIYQMLLLGLIACGVGVGAGFVAHGVLVDILGGLVGIELPAASWVPGLVAMTTGMVALFGFALPPLLRLGAVPALRVLRRDLGAIGTPGGLTYLSGFAALSLLILWNSPNTRLALFTLISVVAALLILGGIAALLVNALRGLHGRPGRPWRFGMSNIARRASGSVIQVVAFGLGIMALLLLSIIRGDLLDEWQASIPEQAPNRFVVNLQPDQVEAFQTYFSSRGAPIPEVHPMIRGRLLKINEQAVDPKAYMNERAQRLASREFNLSWSAELAGHNKVVAGKWWDEDVDVAQYSVETGIAETLGIKLGDVISFEVSGEQFSGKVSSLREVKWDSFQANFFVIAAPGLMQDVPTSWMSSFYLAPDDYLLLNEVVKQFPNITIIDVAAIMQHVRNIISRVTMAVEYVFAFTLLAGIMVLYAGIQSTRDERMLEGAIFRTLGGRHAQLRQAFLAEFVVLGALSGLMAAIIATAANGLLATYVFDMPFHFNPTIWLWGILGGAIGVGLAGMLGVRSVMRQAPLQSLRKIQL